MKVAGEATLSAQSKEVWTALHDPALLAQVIPGCEWLEVTGPGAARFSLALEFTSVAGRYVGEISVLDEQELDYFTVAAAASGAGGTVEAEVTLRLLASNGAATTVSYEASGVVGGRLGAAGARLLVSIASRIAEDFLAAVARQLAASPETASSAIGSPETASSVIGRPETAAVSEPANPVQAAARSAATTAAHVAARVPEGARPRVGVAFGAGVALGLGGVIVAAILGRRNGRRRAGD